MSLLTHSEKFCFMWRTETLYVQIETSFRRNLLMLAYFYPEDGNSTFLQMCANIYRKTRRHTPENSGLHKRRNEYTKRHL
jgi:hypothetical protein